MSRLLEPPEGRQVFQQAFEPEASHIDENGHVNNVVYLDWAQQIATAHWRALAPADQQAAWAWIVLRHEVDYRRPLVLGETAHARTWVADQTDGPRFDRYVRIDGPDGAMCAQAVTTWCLIDIATRRPKRVPEEMLRTFA
ncbi:acyl-CoA thioesterase [Phenylobacterium deserti]|uniref:Acyl-CoA thioesterase n=1 Tax=Phenylobacterium deserti TaxID=1914756 RepID=A0A328APK4_9CAUL|nr:acyl-CoA thioesterase [Phenylobacterium deserti]RAK56509.1 acyl-CoA thioesterase [Phenylobacterium deserti]